MANNIGAQLGLLGFATAIAAGLYAQNDPITVLFRAILTLLLASFIGQFVGWTGKMVIRESLQKRKLQIDETHVREAAANAAATTEETETVTAPEPVLAVEAGQ
ncbi:MAG: hypothetical protein AB7N71_00915 [Phycisphaerae bacterium]